MFGWSKGRASSSVVPREEPAQRGDSAALNVVKRLARTISTLGKDAAEVRGALEDAQRVVHAQGQAMQALRAVEEGDFHRLYLITAILSGRRSKADEVRQLDPMCADTVRISASTWAAPSKASAAGTGGAWSCSC